MIKGITCPIFQLVSIIKYNSKFYRNCQNVQNIAISHKIKWHTHYVSKPYKQELFQNGDFEY